MAAVAAAVAGWETVYLMPNMTCPADVPLVASKLRSLRQQLPKNVTIFIGGQAAGFYLPVIDEINDIYLTGFNDIIEPLGKLRAGTSAL